ncbi:DUF2339 domain-containing protein [Desertibaculum subflavum]|uniref:DUF2339 domain-containing protein n=1 Tax=Desertibaculum subflavum TaxID=2268458 RepID=UPI000E65F4F1
MIEILLLAAVAFVGWRLRETGLLVGQLQAEVQALRRRLDAIETAPRPSEPVEESGASPEVAAAAPVPPPEAALPASDAPVPEVEPVPAAASAAPPPPPPPPQPPAERPRLEELLTVRWAVWLGAGTIALAAIFLVRYSIEQGLLGPTVRIALGLALGLALLAGAEWLRRFDPELPMLGDVPRARVPAALAAAGVVALYASVYSGFELYGLVSPGIAFIAMAVIAALGLALALLHGSLLAVVGQVGAFAVPLLVAGPEPSAAGLFIYLFAVTAGVAGLARYRDWGWTGWIAVAAITAWTLLWLADGYRAGDALAVGLFLVATSGLFAIALAGPLGARGWRADDPGPVALGIFAVLAGLLVGRDGYGTTALIGFAAIAAIMLLRMRWREGETGVEYVPLAVALLLVAAWPLPQGVERPEALGVIEGMAAGFASAPLVPPSLQRFVGWCLGLGVLFGAAGAGGLWGARRPGRWAVLGVTAPVVLFALAYWKVTALDTSLPWLAAALALALLFLSMAARLNGYRQVPGLDAALAAYAVGVTAAVTLACVTTFRTGWLTVALAVELPALAWIYLQLPLRALRRVALALAGIAIVRLLFNPEVAAYDLGGWPILNPLLYTYGLPALAFALAARLFARDRRDLTVEVLEGGAIAFVVALASLQIRHAACGGSIDCADSGLVEAAALTLAWGVIGWALYRARDVHPSQAVIWGGRVVTAIALLLLLFGNLILANPLFNGDAVGAWPVVNALGLAYLAPALLALLFLRTAHRRGQRAVANSAAVTGLVLGLVYLSMEVRRAFVGNVLDEGPVSDGEYYAYSAVWLLYGAALLGLGIGFRQHGLRYASLAILGLTIAKVFLFDMAELTGLLRALSFLGLGLALLGLGWIYQRFVFPPRRPAAPAVSAP